MIKLISEMESTHKVGLANEISAYVVLVVAQTSGFRVFSAKNRKSGLDKCETKLPLVHLRGRVMPETDHNSL